MPIKKTKKTTKKPAEIGIDPRFQPVVDTFAKNKNVRCGRMFSSNSVLNVNGKIFAMLARGKFVVKLPKQRVNDLVSGGQGEHFDPGHRRLMKEWVALGTNEENWIELAKEAYRFVKQGKR